MWAKKYTTLTLCLWPLPVRQYSKQFSWNSFSFHPKKIHFYYFASSLKLTLLPHFFLVCYYFYFSFFYLTSHFLYFAPFCLPRSHTQPLFFEIIKEHISKNFQKLYIFFFCFSFTHTVFHAFMLKRARCMHAGKTFLI